MTKTVFDQVRKVTGQQLEKQDKEILECLKTEGGIHVKASGIKKKSKNVSVAKADFKQHSFAGKEATSMQTLYPRLLGITCPESERTPGSQL